ncbi:hypothetical protein GQ53DRAFT_176317 [Thozetella sp. PMI_491]|nr:hypothetical protein GQ53DRAFT_176317 [Thozetella sp. PMI_491]
MATPSTEQRELELIEKVLFRILGVANNEEKLQALLKTYLPPVLLKLGSEHASVRSKVMEICRERLPAFIQPPSIVLPVATLLDQYKAAQSPLVKHFDLVFIQHSIGRLEPSERRALLPKALRGIGSDFGTGVSSLFNVVLRSLHDLKLPPRGSKEDESFREDIGLSDATDASFVAEWLGKVLLLRSASTQATSAGLTSADLEFLGCNKPNTWDPSAKGLSLAETRVKAANFLSTAAFTDEERFIPAIYASSIPDFRINGIGDDMLKRSSVSLENVDLVRKLFEAHSRLQAPYRIKILGLLSKSEVSTTFTSEILDVFRKNAAPGEQPADAMDIDRAGPSTGSKGLEVTKLHRALFEYINWVARIGPSKTDFSKIGTPLVDMLRDYVYSQGWPKPTNQSLDDITLRSRAYETIGLLAKSTKMPTTEALSLVGWLFRSLLEDPTPDVVVNIDGALSSMLSLFKPPLSSSATNSLRTMLLTYMTMREEGDVVRSVRHAATKWANNSLPFSHISARWIDILAVAGRRDERSDVIEEGHKGLDPWTYYANDEKSTELPNWGSMVKYFFVEPITNLNTTEWLMGRGGMDVDEQSVFANFGGDAILAFPVAVDYCKRILFLTALKDFKIEPGWERQLEAVVQSDKASREKIRAYLADTPQAEEPLLYLLTAAFSGMLREDPTLVEQSARSFAEVASFSPARVVGHLATRAHELFPLITSNKREIRSLGAKAFGILAAHPANSTESISKAKSRLIDITKTFKTAVGSELNAVQGAFVALAHLASRLVYYSTEAPNVAKSGLSEVFPTIESVSSATSSVQEALFDSYAQLWSAAIPTLATSEEQKLSKEWITSAYIEPLVVQAKKGNERAIAALGRLAIAFPSSTDDMELDILTLILEKLYTLYEIKQAEVHFAVGEAITAAVACWDADVLQLTLDVQSDSKTHLVEKRPQHIKDVLQKLLVDCKATKPSLLKASGIWLFCLIQHCSHLEEIHSRLRECQAAFMRLLSARDELVQETASRGLALVYEKGDPALRQELVRDLVSSFTGSGPQLKVDEDTELFDAGALPTGEGKSITSYKDIVSLANEVGDQSLVYKFMSLATNAATWSTRSAFGRFGLSNILSESEVDPKLYPKLYRYRFDPNQNVQKSMNDIWKALVKDSNAVLEEHFDAIMTDLLKSVLGKEWRVREASCAAISDLISGRPFQSYEAYYKAIWSSALKVLDDVKGTVRAAALHLCIALSNTLVRQLEESGSSSSATAMMKEALPFLMSEKGIESGVEDVKIFSTITIIKIAKGGGKSLNDYIPALVPRLLGLLSTIEPDAINYHYLRAGEDNREKIDRIRSAMVSQSPIFEAVENCLRSIDKQVMGEFAPGLENTIKTAVGMPTKIGCSRVLATLAMRHAADFEPYAARFLQVMEKQLLDKNDEVSQNYARAAAYIIRVVPSEVQQKFVDKLISMYLNSEDDTRRAKVADAILGLSKISPDQFNALEGQILPFAYLGKHDTDDDVAKEFEEVWDKHAGSNLTVTRYIPEIVALVTRALDTTQWGLRHAAALTTASAVSSVTNASTLSGQVNLENLKTLWPVYEKALALKTFPSKEKLLVAFPDFVSKGKALWEKDAAFSKLLEKIAIREAKRNNADYRPHAFRCLWRFAAARDDLSLLSTIGDIVTPHLDLSPDEDAMDVDKPKGAKSGGLDLKSETAWTAIEALAKGYNRQKMSENPSAELNAIVEALDIDATGSSRKGSAKAGAPCIATEPFVAIRRGFWYECVSDVFEAAAKSDKASSVDGSTPLSWFVSTLDLDKAVAGTETQRLNRTKAVSAILKFRKKQHSLGAVAEGWKDGSEELGALKKRIESAVVEERSSDVQAAWRACIGLTL